MKRVLSCVLLIASVSPGVGLLEAGGRSKFYHREAVPTKHADHDHATGDEIDREIERYFDQMQNSRSLDVDEQRLQRLFPKRTRRTNGRTSFRNTTSKKESDPVAGIDSHTVREGDTIWSIGQKYGVEPGLIVQHNPMLKKRPLYIGEEILISKLKTRPAIRRRYVRYRRVRSGDTLSGLARAYGTSVAALRKWNGLRSNAIRIGQRLKVGYTARTAIPRGYAVRSMFNMPLPSGRITSGFGRRRNPFDSGYRSFHKGIDIGASLGTPFMAARGGVVILARRMGGYGNCVFIRHSDGYVSVYAHSKQMKVRRGDVVRRGQVIGLVGRTGNATGPHLHFEVRMRKQAINPLAAIRMRELVPGAEIRKAAMK